MLQGTEKSIGTQLGCLTYSAYLLSLDGKMGSNPIVSLDANSQIAFVLHHVLGYKLEEAALLLEAGLRRRFDRIIVVSCKPQQRIERWEKRLHVDADAARREVTRRMMAQAPDEAKIQAADYVIDNSGSVEETRKQVEKVFATLREHSSPVASKRR